MGPDREMAGGDVGKGVERKVMATLEGGLVGAESRYSCCDLGCRSCLFVLFEKPLIEELVGPGTDWGALLGVLMSRPLLEARVLPTAGRRAPFLSLPSPPSPSKASANTQS